MDVVIREMRPDDIGAVVEIIASHCDVDGQCAREYYSGYFGSQERVASLAEQNVVAEDVLQGQVLGVSGFEPDKYKTPGVWWLTWTYVRQDARKKGIGSRLLRRVKAELARLGARKLYIDTSSDEIYEDAVHFYEKHGFVMMARLSGYYGDKEDYLILGTDLMGGAR